MKRILVSCLLVMILLAGLFTACAPAEEKPPPTPPAPPAPPTPPPAEYKPPEVMTVASEDIGSSAHVIATTIVHHLAEELGNSWKVVHMETDIVRLGSVATGETFWAEVSLGESELPMWNLFEWDTPDWEPWTVRNILHASVVPVATMVRGNSDIYELSDLKGKTYAVVPGWSAGIKGVPAQLAFGGLTLDDVTQIPAASYTKSIEMVGDGSADAAYVAPTSGKVIELDAAPAGVRFLPMPHDDKAAWARFLAINPFYPPLVWKYGVLADNPVEMGGAPQFLSVIHSQPEELVYLVVKAFDSGYPKWKDVKPPSGGFYSLDNTLILNKWSGAKIPYHEGFIKYAKEIGEWTAAHEEHQKMAVEAEVERVKAWETKYGLDYDYP